jgi:hypothetical protein
MQASEPTEEVARIAQSPATGSGGATPPATPGIR